MIGEWRLQKMRDKEMKRHAVAGLHGLQEKIENSAREAEATTSMMRREIVPKVLSEVRDLENTAAVCPFAEEKCS